MRIFIGGIRAIRLVKVIRVINVSRRYNDTYIN